MALVAEDHTPFIREVPLTTGTKKEDTILETLKEGEIKMLDSIWKRVKNNWSLSKLQEEVGIWEAVVRVADATGQRPPEFKDHTPYSNRGMEDLPKLNEIASTTRTGIILARSNKTIQACTPLVLTGAKMNVMTEPLHQTDNALPQGLHVCPSYGTYNNGNQKMTIQLYNTKDHAIIIKKGMAVAQMVAANEVPEVVVADGTVAALQTQRWAREGHVEPTVEERRKILFKKLELSGLESCTRENKERPLNLLAEYHDIFALEDGEMGCTKAAEHKIEVMDQKPFKERPRNIPSGLSHMLDMGAIKPSKST